MNTNQKSMRYDQNDYDALLHSKIPAALVETPQMNFDDASDASVFFARELKARLPMGPFSVTTMRELNVIAVNVMKTLQGDGVKLMPNATCTRAQIVTFLYRAMK